MSVRIRDYPQMSLGAWYLDEDATLTDAEAFSFYQRNWKYVDFDKMESFERELLARLIAEQGNGIFVPRPHYGAFSDE
ncbi:hypothetical protein [Yersinia ruckeri]|uniref:hypothetical protein n=1 Tax=Yersinia TaxID=629 RepID=UPI002236F607|nr:hypothetical protein [Yersinia ruckeri]MCW6569859.1 hypothetical protein [Yersinia ruckeri]